MRCLFCGKRLALLRKLTDGEFCSSAHRKRYLEEEQKLALARLIEEQHRSGQRRAAGAAAETRSTEKPRDLAGFLAPQLEIRAAHFAPLAAPQSLERTISPQMVERPGYVSGLPRALRPLAVETAGFGVTLREWARVPGTGGAKECPFPPVLLRRQYAYSPSPVLTARDARPAPEAPPCRVKDSAPPAPRRPKTSILLKLIPPLWPRSASAVAQRAIAEPPLVGAGLVQARAPSAAIRTQEALHLVPAGTVAGPEASGLQTAGIALEHESLSERPGVPERLAPEIRWRSLGPDPGCGPLRMEIPAGPARLGRWTLPRPRLAPAGRAPAQARQVSAGPIALAAPTGRRQAAPLIFFAVEPSGAVVPEREASPAGAVLRETGNTGVPVPALRTGAGTVGRAEAAPFAASAGQPYHPPISAAAVRVENRPAELAPEPAVLPHRMVSLASGGAVWPAPWPACPASPVRLNAAIQPCQPLARAVWRPDAVPGPVLISSAAWQQPFQPESGEVCRRISPPAHAPAPAAQGGLISLELALSPRRASLRRPEANTAPAVLSPKRVLPRLFIETVMPQGLGRKAAKPAGEEPAADIRRAKPWMAAPHFWKRAPADLKWISLALPAILLVTVISSIGWLPSKSATPARGPEPPRSSYIENVVLQRWASVKRNIGNRAAINLQDDFRSGLADWEGEGDWARDWQYDPAGFILTGPLALYRPSSELTDYHFEFLGQIERKSLNWVFRAADHKNYYAMKIVLLKSAPLPTAAILRYAVVNGKADRPVQLPLPLPVRSDMFYRVRVDVRDQNFTTMVQGQVVDFWTDGRLSRGGVGFFSDKGERARLRWMEVSHQYDALGRLCALLAPYSIQSGDGSLNRP